MSYYVMVLVVSAVASRFIFPLLIKFIASTVTKKASQDVMNQGNQNNNSSNYNSSSRQGYNNYSNGRSYNNQTGSRAPGEIYESISVLISFSLLTLLLITGSSTFNIPYGISLLQQLLVGIIMTKTNGTIYSWIFRLNISRTFNMFSGRGRLNNSRNNQYNNQGYYNNDNQYGNNSYYSNGNRNNRNNNQNNQNNQNSMTGIVASAIASKISSSKTSKVAQSSEVDEYEEDDNDVSYSRSYPGLVKEFDTFYGRSGFPINGCRRVIISPSTSELVIEYNEKVLVTKLIKYCDRAFVVDTSLALKLLFNRRMTYPVVPIHINDELIIIVSEYGDSLINAYNELYSGVSTYDNVSFFRLNSDNDTWVAIAVLEIATSMYKRRPAVLISDSIKSDNDIIEFRFGVLASNPINVSCNCHSDTKQLLIKYNKETNEVVKGDEWVKCLMGVIEDVGGSSTKYGQLADRVKSNAINTVLHPISTVGIVTANVLNGVIEVTQKIQPYMKSSAKSAAKDGTLQELAAETKVDTGVSRDGILNDNNIFNYIFSLGHFTCTVTKAYLPTLQGVIVLKLESDTDKSYVLNRAGDSWITINMTTVLKEFKSRIINIMNSSLTGCINWWILIGEDLQFVSIVYNLADNTDDKESIASTAMSFIYSNVFSSNDSNGVIDFVETITPIDTSKITEKSGVNSIVSTQKYFSINRLSFSYDLIKQLGIIETAKDTPLVHDVIRNLLGPSFFKGSFSNAVKLSDRLNPRVNCVGRVVSLAIGKDRYDEILESDDCLSAELDSNVNPMKLYGIYSAYEDLASPLFGIGYLETQLSYRMNLGYCIDAGVQFKEVIDELFKTPLSVALFSDTAGERVTKRTDVSLFIFCKRTIEEA